MADIKAGVVLSLKDQFSGGMNKAAGAGSNFANKTLGAINKVDKALSGTAAKLAAFGVTLSVGAAAKGIIELDHRMTRLGLTANASTEDIAGMKKALFDVAKSSDIKLDPANILSGLEVIMTKKGDLKFAEANIRNIALAIQASGESGAPIGDVFSEFAKAGYSAQEISRLMDDMVAQSDKGEFTFAEFAKNAKGVISAYSVIGNSPQDIKRANAAMQILTAGTKSSEVATTVLNSAINELCDPAKREKLQALGIQVRDMATGQMRDFNDIMLDISDASKDLRKGDLINSVFGSETIKAVRAYNSEFAKTLPALLELGDTTGFIEQKSAKMAGTLQSNLQNLQTSFNSFIDSYGSGALKTTTDVLNKLAEDPERIKKVFTGIAVGIGAIAAVKGIAGITRLVGSLTQLKGGKINLGESLSMASAMPVYVTNMGGGMSIGGGPGMSAGGAPQGTILDRFGRPIPKTISGAPVKPPGALNAAKTAVKGLSGAQLAGAGIMGGITGAFSGAVDFSNEMQFLKENENQLSGAEKGKLKGGAYGNFAGKTIGGVAGGVAGMAAGAAVGAAVGSVIPGIGTAVGLIVGGAIGAAGIKLGGAAGRKIGEEIGEAAVSGFKENHWEQTIPKQIFEGVSMPGQYTEGPQFGGEAVMDVNVNLSGDRPTASVSVRENSTSVRFNTGSAVAVRGNAIY